MVHWHKEWNELIRTRHQKNGAVANGVKPRACKSLDWRRKCQEVSSLSILYIFAWCVTSVAWLILSLCSSSLPGSSLCGSSNCHDVLHLRSDWNAGLCVSDKHNTLRITSNLFRRSDLAVAVCLWRPGSAISSFLKTRNLLSDILFFQCLQIFLTLLPWGKFKRILKPK